MTNAMLLPLHLIIDKVKERIITVRKLEALTCSRIQD